MSRDKPAARFSAYERTTSLLSTVRSKTQHCRCAFAATIPRKAYPLPQSRGAGESEAGTSYCGCSRSRLGPAALWTELNDQDIEPILEEREHRWRPEWTDIAHRSPMYNSYWTQWKSLSVKNGILEHLGAEWTTYWQNCMVDPQEVTWGSTTPWMRFGIGTTGSRQEMMFGSGAGSATFVQPTAASKPGIGAKCISKTSVSRSKG
jgi:hypothetical protein